MLGGKHKNISNRNQGYLASSEPNSPSQAVSVILGSCDPEILGSWDLVVQGVLQHLGVELLLGVVVLAAEFTPKVCSGHWPRQERVPWFLYTLAMLDIIKAPTL